MSNLNFYSPVYFFSFVVTLSTTNIKSTRDADPIHLYRSMMFIQRSTSHPCLVAKHCSLPSRKTKLLANLISPHPSRSLPLTFPASASCHLRWHRPLLLLHSPR